MKNIIFLIFLILLFSVGCDQKQQAKNTKQQWDYTVVYFEKRGSMESKLKSLGDNGWEYAGPLAGKGLDGKYIAFKRPK